MSKRQPIQKDVMQEAFNYLGKVPAGTSATVLVRHAKELSYFKVRSIPLHEVIREWAKRHELLVSFDRPDPATATQFYLRKETA